MTGTPPTGPCSIVQVTAPCRPSSIRMRGTWAETPKPSAATSPCGELHRGAPRDHLLRCRTARPRARRGRPASRPRAPDRRRVPVACICSGSTTTTSTSEHGTCTSRVAIAPAGTQALDLGDHEAAAVARGERQIERAERRGLVLHRDVAARVGGGAADDRDVGRDVAEVQPLLAVELDQRGRCLRCAARFILPPSRRGSTKVSSPVRVSTPARPAATSRSMSKISPLGRL